MAFTQPSVQHPAALLRACQFCIGNDTSALNMAVANDVPTWLFGASPPDPRPSDARPRSAGHERDHGEARPGFAWGELAAQASRPPRRSPGDDAGPRPERRDSGPQGDHDDGNPCPWRVRCTGTTFSQPARRPGPGVRAPRAAPVQEPADKVAHGRWMDDKIATADDEDILVFVDIDAFPITRAAYENAVEEALVRAVCSASRRPPTTSTTGCSPTRGRCCWPFASGSGVKSAGRA